MLEVKNLSVVVGDKELIHNVSFRIPKNETTLLLGPNGAGKSTLAGSLAGLPKFQITGGKITFMKCDITSYTLDARARTGIFLSFQTPVEIPGISTKDFLRSVLDQTDKLSREDFESRLKYARNLLYLDPFFPERDLNVGLSGGEKKKNEILQLLTLRPKLAILDEIDSGLDSDSAKVIAKALAKYKQDFGCTYLVITHNFHLLKHLAINRALVLDHGRLVRTGGMGLISKIRKQGFKGVLSDESRDAKKELSDARS